MVTGVNREPVTPRVTEVNAVDSEIWPDSGQSSALDGMSIEFGIDDGCEVFANTSGVDRDSDRPRKIPRHATAVDSNSDDDILMNMRNPKTPVGKSLQFKLAVDLQQIRMMRGKEDFDFMDNLRRLPVENLTWGSFLNLAPHVRRHVAKGLVT